MKHFTCLLVFFFTIPFYFQAFSQKVELTKGLVAYYPFDGNASDASGGNNNGQVLGGAELQKAKHCYQDSYYFDGYQGYIDCGNGANLNSMKSGLTVASWVYISPTNKVGLSLIVGKWAFNKTQDHFGLFIGGKNTMAFSVGDGKTLEEGIFGKNTLQTNTWYHVVGVWRADGEMAIFLNGKLNNTGRQTGKGINTASNVSLKLGRQVEGADRPFKGYLDEVRVYNRALSTLEIEALYNRDHALCNQIVLQGKIINTKTGQPVAGEVIVEDLETGKELTRTTTDKETLEYAVGIPIGGEYAIYPNVEGYLPISSNIDTKGLQQDMVIKRDLRVVPFEVGQTVRLNNLFFDSGKSTLRKTSFQELNKLVKLMQRFPNLKIEIEGHTDNVGTDESNQKLSEDRAKAVRDYLEKQQIAKEKVQFVGYGEAKPVANNATEDGKQLNRRVEFKILSK